MNTKKAELEALEAAQRRLRALSPERLRVAMDFLAYLAEREANEATEELLKLPGFPDALANALKEAESGQVVRFEDVRRGL